MLDSPFVRRVAISMRLLDIEFEHVSQSVVAGYDTFKSINPLAKAPTLVLDDGEMMIESTLIISHVEALAGRTLTPDATDDQRRALQVIGVALLGMDKVVAQIYETEMRPQEFQYDEMTQADITTAVAWRFLELRAPDQLHVEERPALAAFGARAEAIPEFMACPVE
jgi:glutathione S-transferase